MVYDEDDMLLSLYSVNLPGVQNWIAGMHQSCLSLGLTMSPIKTQVAMFYWLPTKYLPDWPDISS